MSDLSQAVARSGALDANMLRELVRWRLPGVVVPDDGQFNTPEEAVEAIEEAVTSKDQVEVRVTDLDVLKNFLQTRKTGKLHIVNDEGPSEQEAKGTWSVTFGTIKRTNHTDYILPWNSDSIEALLTNGRSYLLDDKKRVYFSLVTELYFGDQKAFIVCTPTKEDHAKRDSKQD